MKKIVLSLAGVLAATAFAPEASALPAFARQTGMACTACHFQHFPVLNSFGRAFRAAGYTMMGAQGKVEGDHLSIPDTLNAGFLLKAIYSKTNGTDPAGTVSGTTTNSGRWDFPNELVVLFGGRVAENVGMLVELNTLNGSANIGSGFKMPFIYDVSGAKVGLTPFYTDGQGVFFGYEQSSSGMVRASRWSEDRTAISAPSYAGLMTAATGVAFHASNDMGFVALTRYAPHWGSNAGTGAVSYKANALRLSATPNIGDWSMLIGGAILNGDAYTATAPAVGSVPVDAKATIIDIQAQGQLGGKDTSFYLNYAKADGSPVGGKGNFFNTRLTDRKAWVAAVDYSVIPHTLSIGASYRRADAGYNAANLAAGNTQDKDNAFSLMAVYDLYQNVALQFIHKMQSGSAYGVGGVLGGATGTPANGKNVTTMMLEAAW